MQWIYHVGKYWMKFKMPTTKQVNLGAEDQFRDNIMEAAIFNLFLKRKTYILKCIFILS